MSTSCDPEKQGRKNRISNSLEARLNHDVGCLQIVSHDELGSFKLNCARLLKALRCVWTLQNAPPVPDWLAPSVGDTRRNNERSGSLGGEKAGRSALTRPPKNHGKIGQTGCPCRRHGAELMGGPRRGRSGDGHLRVASLLGATEDSRRDRGGWISRDPPM